MDTNTTPLLTAEEETALAERIQAGLRAREKIKTALPAERSLCESYIQEADAAMEEIVNRNLGLASWIVLKNVSMDHPDFEDLTQEARWGLFIAAQRFDPQRGFRFATYATWWVRQKVQRYLGDRGDCIHVPAHMHNQLIKVPKVKRKLRAELEREPTLEEIANDMGVNSKSLSKGLDARREPISLDAPLEIEDERTWADVVGDPDVALSAQHADKALLCSRIDEALGALPPRLAKVVRLYFGLDNHTSHIFEEIGQELQITRERARQLLEEALAVLRQNSRSRPLRAFVNAEDSYS